MLCPYPSDRPVDQFTQLRSDQDQGSQRDALQPSLGLEGDGAESLAQEGHVDHQELEHNRDPYGAPEPGIAEEPLEGRLAGGAGGQGVEELGEDLTEPDMEYSAGNVTFAPRALQPLAHPPRWPASSGYGRAGLGTRGRADTPATQAGRCGLPPHRRQTRARCIKELLHDPRGYHPDLEQPVPGQVAGLPD